MGVRKINFGFKHTKVNLHQQRFLIIFVFNTKDPKNDRCVREVYFFTILNTPFE